MGIICRYECENCKRVKNLNLGHGLMHSSFDQVKAYFLDEKQAMISELMNDHGYEFSGFDFVAASCEECMDFVAVPVVTLIKREKDNEDKTIIVGKCNASHEISKEKLESQICPICTSMNVKKIIAGRWD